MVSDFLSSSRANPFIETNLDRLFVVLNEASKKSTTFSNYKKK